MDLQTETYYSFVFLIRSKKKFHKKKEIYLTQSSCDNYNEQNIHAVKTLHYISFEKKVHKNICNNPE